MYTAKKNVKQLFQFITLKKSLYIYNKAITTMYNFFNDDVML